MRTTLTNNMLIVVSLLVVSLLTATSSAAEWGSIKGRFLVDGAPPQLPPLVVAKDEFCIQTKPKNESVVVGKDGGLANAVVFLSVPRRGKVEVHPDYQAQLNEPSVLDNKGCAFVPHVTLVRVGQPFIIKNSDPNPVSHNTKATLLQNATFNVIIPVGAENKMTFGKAENMPMPVNCNIHPFMEGHVLIQDHPYMAVSTDEGTFEIKNVPAGKHQFAFWHESGWIRNAKVGAAKTDRRGRAELTVPTGDTLDLGDIKVPASALK